MRGVGRAEFEDPYGRARPLTAFAFRVHTHALGREVFLERLVAGRMTATNETEPSDGSSPVRLMGRDPQLPQLFERLAEPLIIRPVGVRNSTPARFVRHLTAASRARRRGLRRDSIRTHC